MKLQSPKTLIKISILFLLPFLLCSCQFCSTKYDDGIPDELKYTENYNSLNYIYTPGGKKKIEDLRVGDEVLSFDGVEIYVNTIQEIQENNYQSIEILYLTNHDTYMQITDNIQVYLPEKNIFSKIDYYYEDESKPKALFLKGGDLKITPVELKDGFIGSIENGLRFVLENTDYNNLFYNGILVHIVHDEEYDSAYNPTIPFIINDFFAFLNDSENTYEIKHHVLLGEDSSFYEEKTLTLDPSDGGGYFIRNYPSPARNGDEESLNYLNFVPDTERVKNDIKIYTNISIYDTNGNFLYRFTNSIDKVATAKSNFILPLKFSLNHQYWYQVTIDDSTFENSFLGTTNE